MPTFTTEDGAELYYQVEGTERGNPPLLFIHGWCSNLTHWEQQVRAFQDSHRILRMTDAAWESPPRLARATHRRGTPRTSPRWLGAKVSPMRWQSHTRVAAQLG